MKQLLLSLQRLYESKILEADHQVKHYATNSLAINEHSEVTKEIDKWIDIKAHNEGKLRQVLAFMPKPEENSGKKSKEAKKDG
jgi:predicted proteasome-type protease